jgi:hypothetical protein
MVTNCFGSRNFMQPEKAQRRLDFFFWLLGGRRGGGGWFVFTMYSLRGSQWHFIFYFIFFDGRSTSMYIS